MEGHSYLNGTSTNGGANGSGSGSGSGSESLAGTVSDERGEIFEDSMMLWKNDDWSQLQIPVEKGKKDDGRSPWAGKNPTAALRVGEKEPDR